MRRWLLLALVGCGHTCPAFQTPPFDITVTDSATGSAVCNATVTATSGNTSVVLTALVVDESCTYGQTAGNVPTGVYTLTVTAPGFMPAAVDGLVVSKGDCGFEPTATRTVVLTAQ